MVRLIVYNIEYCQGFRGSLVEYFRVWRFIASPKNLDFKMAEELKKLSPDILALVEVDTGSIRANRKNKAKFFKDELEMLDFADSIKYIFKGWYRVFKVIPILNKQGNAILSKTAIYDIKYHHFSLGAKKIVIEAKIKIPQDLTLFLVHLALSRKTREKQLQELAKIINDTKGNIIVMGDFNTFKGKEEINDFLINTNLNCASLTKNENILTYPSFRPKKELDYVLSSKNINVLDYRACNFNFSDHLPLLVDFEINEN